MRSAPECSVVVPVYRNEADVPALVARLAELDRDVPGGIEAVLVVDGSPDRCHALLGAALETAAFPSRLLLLSRNFGSFSAIRAGLGVAGGTYLAVMAADLQEPAELVRRFFEKLRADEADLVVGTRSSRADPQASRLGADLFWWAYRRLVVPELPPGGVDIFGCNRRFRDQLLKLEEARSSLIGQLYWLGFRRAEVAYDRQVRERGVSAWTLRKKLNYLSDSLYAFSDLPIRLFTLLGGLGVALATVFAVLLFVLRILGTVNVPGYTATVVTILFFAGLNLLGLGILGSYVWRTYENTKARPLAVVMSDLRFDGATTAARVAAPASTETPA